MVKLLAKLHLEKKKKIAAIIFLIMCQPTLWYPIWCGNEMAAKIYNPTLGRGKGSRGFKRKFCKRPIVVDLWASLQVQNDRIFESLTRMKKDEFVFLVDEMKHQINSFAQVAQKMTFENKLLLILLWIVKYPEYASLSVMFGVSKSVISVLLNVGLPLFVDYFSQFVKNEIESDSTSSLSHRIVAVIDSTIHTTKKPSKNQHLSFSNHYNRHGMMTNLLVNFDGYIVAFVTGGAARMNDSMASYFFPTFVRALGSKYCLGDPGYQGVPYVVSGLKSNQLLSHAHHQFDRVSRSEQVVVEHVNCFIKSCKSLSKRNQFIHGREKHIACVIIVCGWHNWMKASFGKFSSNL